MTSTQSSAKIIGLVARREFTTRVVTKAYLISTAIMLAIIVGGQVAIAALSDGDDRAKVGVVSSPSVSSGIAGGLEDALESTGEALDEPVEVKRSTDVEAGRQDVADGDLHVLLVEERPGYVAVTESEIDAGLRAVLDTATQQIAVSEALAAQNVDPALLARAGERAAITVNAIDPVDPDKDQRLALAYIAVVLLFFTVYLYGIYVAMGVVEEKASRVVELLLSTIRPIHLLLGKVIGIGAVGLIQVVLFGGAALATGLATGLVTVGGTAVALLASVLIWYVLGYAFFAMLYAALGSLVNRQEDVNSVTMPLTVLAFAMFFSAQAGLQDPESSWVSVLAWVPPFSATLMPLRIAAGVASASQVAGTVVIMLVGTAVVAVVAARVYERSVLHAGGKKSLKQALTNR